MSAQDVLTILVALVMGSVFGVLATGLAQQLAEKGRRDA